MSDPRSVLSLDQINTITKLEVCPDCGGPILNGPYGASREHFTCGSCQMDFLILLTDPLSGNRTGINPARAAFYDPSRPEQHCLRCDKIFHGPSMYCCVRCAIDDV